MKYSNIHEDQKKDLSTTIFAKDRARLREMAKRWIEIALSDEMQEKKSAWRTTWSSVKYCSTEVPRNSLHQCKVLVY